MHTGTAVPPLRYSSQIRAVPSKLATPSGKPVLPSLADEPKHRYAITQDVAENKGVRLSAGTLYAVISRLESRGLIEPLESEDRHPSTESA